MKLPTLYKLRSDKQIQIWEIEIEGDKYRTISGIQGGKLVTSTWTTCTGKNTGKANSTSPEQQALREAEALLAKKASREYSRELTSAGSFEWFKPMLAKNYLDHIKKITFPVAIQPKLDGIRCITSAGGAQSREGKIFKAVPHIISALSPIWPLIPRLDGELYNPDLSDNFEQIVHLVKQETPTPEELESSARLIQYWIYDIPGEEDFLERWKSVAAWHIDTPCIHVVPTYICNSWDEIRVYHKQFTSGGYEGTIIRKLGVPYQNKRTDALLKMKDFTDEEFPIVRFEEGVGKRQGTAGTVICVNSSGQEFGSGIKGDLEYVTSLWTNRNQYPGKMATICYQNLTRKNQVPRFGVMKGVRDYESNPTPGGQTT